MPRTVRCTGSVARNRGRARTSSRWADEGTAAHEVAKWHLQNWIANGEAAGSAMKYLGEYVTVEGKRWEVTEEMCRCVDLYVKHCMALAATMTNPTMLVEQRVYYHDYLNVPKEDAFGTTDFVCFDNKTIAGVDFKFGAGVKVYAYEQADESGAVRPNEQLACYVLGALWEHGVYCDFERVIMAVCQPRIDVDDGGWFHQVEVTVYELLAFAEDVIAPAVAEANVMIGASDEALMNAGMLTPGFKQCKFCDAKADCPAALAESMPVVLQAAAVDAFDDLDAVSIPQVKERLQTAPLPDLAAIYAKRDFIYEIVDAVTAEVERRVLAGEPVPDVTAPGQFLKIVEGKRGNRAWVDVEKAETELRRRGVELYEPKPKSPATVETDLKAAGLPAKEAKAFLAELAAQAPGKPHVTHARDPRPAIELAAKPEDFANLDDDLHPAALALVAQPAHPFRR